MQAKEQIDSFYFVLFSFSGAFLLFFVQPMTAKALLPAFGGTAAVWTHCLLFFQSGLLGGYLYAHLLGRLPDVGRQLRIHLIFSAAGVAWTGFYFLKLPPSADQGTSETASLLLWLATGLGIPYVLLAATSPLAQKWFTARFPERDPYPLFAWSNTGSFLALLTYPFVLEPWVGLESHRILWIIGLAACVALLGRITRMFSQGERTRSAALFPAQERTDGVTAALWILLPALGTVALVAFTQALTHEVAPMPFLWVLPLSLYLLSFVLPFDKRHLYSRIICGPLLIGALALLMWSFSNRGAFGLMGMIGIFGGALFFLCLCLHGELHRLRPAPSGLTLYYLAIAFGGALGGIASGILAPRIFSGFWELHLSIFGGSLLLLLCWYFDASFAAGSVWKQPLWVLLLSSQGALGLSLASHAAAETAAVLEAGRNFYGVLRVLERPYGRGLARFLQNGNIMHGWQYTLPEEELTPGGYYWPLSGIGLALTRHPKRIEEGSPLKIGVIGLGVGTLAAYAGKEDRLRFYEINPEVLRMARQYFTYLATTEAPLEIVLGDARVQMERELQAGNPQRFDLLVVDAFNGDAIPVHLMTAEAVSIYLQHLEPDGILAFHITNQYVNLSPVIRGLGTRFGLRKLIVGSPSRLEDGHWTSVWGILTRNPDFLKASSPDPPLPIQRGRPDPEILWTDDFASLLPLLGKADVSLIRPE